MSHYPVYLLKTQRIYTPQEVETIMGAELIISTHTLITSDPYFI